MAVQPLVLHQRPQIGDEAVPARNEFVELPATAQVLVVEDVPHAESGEELGLE